jgi:lipopolysaccharide transport system ATP-binding protein
MTQPAVVFDQVWKKFRMGERHDSLRDLVPALVRRRSKTMLGAKEFWAVQDVSFEVGQGEALGIIGPNGAGKSTMLKLLTRIMKPTRGTCSVRGRVGALIEVAAGFHADLTGRENIFLQGAIMGMRRPEIFRKLDEIIEFSGIGPFIDTQVKRYSSGMQARLGFSVAAHLDPDVLFIDEVLSVGDMSFQARCIERMQAQLDAGVTLVFVSHNLQAVAALCNRALVLAKGRMLFDGPADEALDVYVRASQTSSQKYGLTKPRFRLLKAEFVLDDGHSASALEPGARCTLRTTFECLEPAENCHFGLELERTRDLLCCHRVTSDSLGEPLVDFKLGEIFDAEFSFLAHLVRGHYRVNVYSRNPLSLAFYMAAENVAHFTIEEQRSSDGVAEINPRVRVMKRVAPRDRKADQLLTRAPE